MIKGFNNIDKINNLDNISDSSIQENNSQTSFSPNVKIVNDSYNKVNTQSNN